MSAFGESAGSNVFQLRAGFASTVEQNENWFRSVPLAGFLPYQRMLKGAY